MAKKIKKVAKPPHLKFRCGGKPLPQVKTAPVNPRTKRGQGAGGAKIDEVSPHSGVGVKRTKIRVIGIGGGGGSIVSSLSQRIKKASFVVANTDRQALKSVSHKALRFLFGQNLTYGLGTGMNSEIAVLAAQNEKEKIKKLLSSQDLCIIVACLGGGTGSGAAPIFAKIARNLGNLTYGIFTLPFQFEGEKKARIAREALEKLKPNLNTFSIIPNERIFQIVEKNTPLKIALSAINKNLAESLEALLETIYEPGLINIDFADLRTIFDGRGRLTYLNSVEISGLEKDEDLIKKVLHSPLYPYTMRGAKGILFNIVGEKNLELSEVSKISKTISDSVNREAKIIFGISQKKFHDHKQKERKVKITILATGCGQRIFSTKEKKSRKKIIIKTKKREKKRKKIKSFPKTQKKVKKTQPPKQKIKAKIKIKTQPRLAELGGVQEKKRLRPTRGRGVPLRGNASRPDHPLTRPPTQKRKIKPEKIKVKPPTPIGEKSLSHLPTSKEIEVSPVRKAGVEFFNGLKVRRNALEIKKDIEEEEKEIEAEEKKWETPAFLRRKLEK